MPGYEQTTRALSTLDEVRELIREAEVELRESVYYPPPETRHHFSEAASNLAAAEQSLRTVLELLGPLGKTASKPAAGTEEKEEQEE
jgi:hypothetical protein